MGWVSQDSKVSVRGNSLAGKPKSPLARKNHTNAEATSSLRAKGKRVGGSAYWRIGVWESKTAFRHGYNDQEVSTELMMLCKRRHADTPIRFRSRPMFNAALRAAAGWLVFRIARSTRMSPDMGALLPVRLGPP